MRKLKDPEPDLHLWRMDPDPGGQKTWWSCGSGSPTLLFAALTFSFVLQDLRRPARVVTILLFVWRGWPIQANSTSAWENIEEYQYNILMSMLRKMSETHLYWCTNLTIHKYWKLHVHKLAVRLMGNPEQHSHSKYNYVQLAQLPPFRVVRSCAERGWGWGVAVEVCQQRPVQRWPLKTAMFMAAALSVILIQ
jgi:hypothetical protein